MSKAFTKENDTDEPDLDPPELEAASTIKNYITPQGYQRLKAELADLWGRERPELVQTVAWAAANGDRSENADYIYGKRRLREIDKRIRFLSKRLDLAEIVDASARTDEQVFFGATVTVLDENNKSATYRIVGVDEIDTKKGDVSWLSPVAKALLQARVGDVVTVNSPAGEQELQVLKITY